ncbi:2-methoxy-6-polyprenyl-1,4-benzoquinol methylase, mitochondrial [Microplitis demolitor]|uniref:2-methoxy-6-polyprenyl-1,4-benzoquinol methylase, mitochondrial n=1 Tax=Microplitis demolitor TaxID=69319 RepID=UPI0004400390|nr:2-methoxy-6-polyprenyl-1,4-benzoquinol methylase, mitochondrial [Microplitis demolitor]
MHLNRQRMTLIKNICNKLFLPKNEFAKTFRFNFSTYANEEQKSQWNNNEEPTTHFGFKTVKESDKSKEVYTVFEKVADSYDLMNDAMSFGVHRLWKDLFIQELAPTHGSKLLDTAGGTGDITFRYLNYLNNLKNPKNVKSYVTVSDINQNMLDVGKLRAKKLGFTSENGYNIDWLQNDAEKLSCPDESFTAYTIAFGIRNVTHIDKVLSEAYRVLQPGGRFLCLEFSHVTNDSLKWLYDQYSFQLIPVMGKLIAGQWEPYQYLVESIRKFPKQEELKGMIEEAGFRQVTYKNLTFGVVAIHSGFKI